MDLIRVCRTLKHLTSIGVCLGILSLCGLSTSPVVFAACTHDKSGTITVLEPNGGEVWRIGQKRRIRWSYRKSGAYMPPTVTVSIQKRRGGDPQTSWKDVRHWITGVSGRPIRTTDGQFILTLRPKTSAYRGIGVCTRYRVRVKLSGSWPCDDRSDRDFAIIGGPYDVPRKKRELCGEEVLVKRPNGGEKWKPGRRYLITWNSLKQGNLINIQLWRSGVWTGKYIVQGTKNDGRYTWKIPKDILNSDDYQIKIVSKKGSIYASPIGDDFSNGKFTISKGKILRVLVPNGGEYWSHGLSYTIKWRPGNAGPRVKIKLSWWCNTCRPVPGSGRRYGRTVSRTIVGSTRNDGSYTWRVPNALPNMTGCRITISSTRNPKINDKTDKGFTILTRENS